MMCELMVSADVIDFAQVFLWWTFWWFQQISSVSPKQIVGHRLTGFNRFPWIYSDMPLMHAKTDCSNIVGSAHIHPLLAIYWLQQMSSILLRSLVDVWVARLCKSHRCCSELSLVCDVMGSAKSVDVTHTSMIGDSLVSERISILLMYIYMCVSICKSFVNDQLVSPGFFDLSSELSLIVDSLATASCFDSTLGRSFAEG